MVFWKYIYLFDIDNVILFTGIDMSRILGCFSLIYGLMVDILCDYCVEL